MLVYKNLGLQLSNTKFNIFQLLGAVSLASIIISILINNTSSKIIYVLAIVSISLLLSFNIRAILFFLITIVLTPKFAQIHHSILLVLFLIPSAIFNYKIFLNKNYKNPLLKALIFFVLLASISLINAPKNIFTLFEYFNVIAFCILILFVPFMISRHSQIAGFFIFFLFLMTAHSIFVISQTISSGGRAFGLLGVFYTDFAGLAFLYSVILFIYSSGSKKILFGLSSVINLVGLIFSQTRNSWLSTFLILIVLFALLFFRSSELFVHKKYIMRAVAILTIIIVALLSVLMQSSDANVSKRLDTKSQEVQLSDNTESVNENSFVARLFIWHTAINAFSKEPIVGIGLYSFKYTTHKYYTIPKPFFKQFVEFKTPHVAYLEILVETGIIGFIGFLFFLITVIKLTITSLKWKVDKQMVISRVLIAITIFYIVISMAMTEAWLYGQYLVWFGIVLGALISDYRITHSKMQP